MRFLHYLKQGRIRPIIPLPAPPRLYLKIIYIYNAYSLFRAYHHGPRPKGRLAFDVIPRAATEFKQPGGDSVNFSPTLGETFAAKMASFIKGKPLEVSRKCSWCHPVP